MTMILQFTNKWGERFYFQNLGLQWPKDPSKRLIERTTPRREEARVFETEEAAREVLVTAGSPKEWTIEPV